MSKKKSASRGPEKKKAAKRAPTVKTTAVSANDNQSQIDSNPETTSDETPGRKPVTNADEQKKTSNTDSGYGQDDDEAKADYSGVSQEEDGGYEGPNDPSKRGDDPDKTRREQPKMK